MMVKFPKMREASKQRWADHVTREKYLTHLSEVHRSMIGKPVSNETKEKLREINLGRKLPKEACEKISRAMVGKRIGDFNPMFGRSPTNKEALKSEKILLKRIETLLGGFWYGNVRYRCVMARKRCPPITEETRQKMRVPHNISPQRRKQLVVLMRAKRGSLNPRWRGGISTLNHRIRDSARMLQWREDVFKRDDYTCQVTRQYGGRLMAHHIIPFSVLMHLYMITTFEQAMACEALWDVSNGKTLSVIAHRLQHQRKKEETWTQNR